MPTLFILPGTMYVDSVYLNRVVRTNKNIANAVNPLCRHKVRPFRIHPDNHIWRAKLKLLRIYYILRTQLCLFAKLRIKLLLKGLDSIFANTCLLYTSPSPRD